MRHLRAAALLSALFLLLALPAVYAQAVTSAGDYAIYVVQQGQTLASIAGDAHVPVATLALYNRMGVGDKLVTGQVLLVPQVAEAPAVTTPTTTTPPTPPPSTTPPTVTTTPPVVTPPPTTTTTAVGDTVSGVIASVTAEVTKIYNPANGQVLYSKATRGMKLLVVGQSGDYYAVLMEAGATGLIAKGDLALSTVTKTIAKPQPAPAPTVGRMDVVEAARKYLGVPYEYGGKLPDTVDCSLLVQTAFKSVGVTLPRTAADQSQVGVAVKFEDLVAGDRLYFYKRGTNEIGHTGIYIGNGDFIHASSNRKMVAISNLSEQAYSSIYAWACR
jgi:cell wall-associated NlpC family hydrolase